MALLEIRDLTVTFATGSGPFKAVDKFNLSINPGEVTAIVGESGSGKSVAMLALMGLLPKTATVTAARRWNSTGTICSAFRHCMNGARSSARTWR